MTCKQVLGLIDAGQFVNYPTAHLEGARQPARQCDSCGAGLDAATALTTNLDPLPQPASPPDLAAAVLERISRIEERLPVARPAFAAKTRRPSSVRDWSTWAIVSGGVAAGLAFVLPTVLNSTPPDISLLS